MLNRIQFISFTAVGALFALTAVITPATAADLAQNLGPVGPYDTLLTTVGSKRVLAFYEPNNGHCGVNAVVWDKTDADTGMTSAARVRISLKPGEMVHIDSAEKSLNLQCGDNSATLSIVGISEIIRAE
jgi:hypothetical protein